MAQALDTSSQEDKILSLTPLINSIAKKMARRLPADILPEDLIGAGVIGLIDAINRFDPTKNVMFKYYARYRIEGAMWDELRALDWVPRSVRRKRSQYTKVCQNLQNKKGEPPGDEEIASELGLSLYDYYSFMNEIRSITFQDVERLSQAAFNSQGKDSAECIFEKEEDPSYFITIREQRQAMARAIDTLSEKEKNVIYLYYYEELTLKTIGEILGLTEGRVSQIHKRAIMRLKVRIKETGIVH